MDPQWPVESGDALRIYCSPMRDRYQADICLYAYSIVAMFSRALFWALKVDFLW